MRYYIKKPVRYVLRVARLVIAMRVRIVNIVRIVRRMVVRVVCADK